MNKKKIFLIIVSISLSIIIIAASLLAILLGIMHHAANLEYYEVLDERIPTIYSVIGKRSVTGVAIGNYNGIPYQQYRYYGMDSARDDIEKYISFLCNEQGFTQNNDLEKDSVEGEVKLWKKIEPGKEILITISYSIGIYTVLIQNT